MAWVRTLTLLLCIVAYSGDARRVKRKTDVTQTSAHKQTFAQLVNAKAQVEEQEEDSWYYVGSICYEKDGVSFYQVLGEFLGTMVFVFIGCGCACAVGGESGYAWVLQVAFTFAMGYQAAVAAIPCAAQLNFVVTLVAACNSSSTHVNVGQMFCNWIAQIIGSCCAALLLKVLFENHDKTGSLGCNAINADFTQVQAILGEAVMTFVLIMVVLESPANVTWTIFVCHSVLIPITGCSVNPTRSTGPALVAKFVQGKEEALKDLWVFWVGPLAGMLVAWAIHAIFHNK